MSVESVRFKFNATANSFRGPSGAIWGDCPYERFYEHPEEGMTFFDDFLMAGTLTTTNAQGSFGQWASWADTSAVLGTDPQQDGGVILLSDATNITKNITLASNAGAFRMVSAATNNPLVPAKLWFECRVAVGSITTAKKDAFIGLVDNTTSMATASATGVINTGNVLATGPNLFGFHFRSTTNPTDVGLAFNVAGGTVQYPTNLQTLSTTVAGAALTAETAGATGALATGFVKLGFIYDPAPYLSNLITSASSSQTAGNLAGKCIRVFVNGQEAPAFLTKGDNVSKSTFPTGWMGPAISYTSRAASASGGFYVDWIRVAQQAQS